MHVIVRLRLLDADRERYGCAEWIEVDFLAITAWEAALIQRGFTRDGIHVGFDSPGAWRSALRGEIVLDGNGAPVMVPIEVEGGEPRIVEKRRPDFGAELVLVWLALRRAGVDLSMAEVDYDTDGLKWDMNTDFGDAVDEEPVPGESEGKGDAASPGEPLSIPTLAS